MRLGLWRACCKENSGFRSNNRRGFLQQANLHSVKQCLVKVVVTNSFWVENQMAFGNGMDPDSLNPARVSAATAAIEKLNNEYPNLARSQLGKVRRIFAARDSVDADTLVSELHGFAHDQYGQGATFNYPLISEIAQSLRAYLKRSESLGEMQPAIIETYFEAMDETFDKALCGEFGREGAMILERLNGLSAPR